MQRLDALDDSRVGLHAARLLAAARRVAPRVAQVRRHELGHPLVEEYFLVAIGLREARVNVLAPGVAEIELLVGS